jgi:NTE family protein
LIKHGLEIDMVAGSSIGALIGSMYCCGVEFKYVKALFKNLSQKTYVDVAVPRVGFVKGDRVQEIIKVITKDCEFKDLKIPLIVAATDLKNKKLCLIKEGKVHEAIRASISIPGVFIPYMKDENILVDGGVLERVPAKSLKDAGMDFVIGVDVGSNLTTSSCKTIFHVIFESIDLLEKELFALKKHDCDIIQGFYYGKPMPVKELDVYMKKTNYLNIDLKYLGGH